MADINVTPLVDVMLVLLIIFMLTAPMLQNEVDVNLPTASGKPRTPTAEQMVLTITKQDGIYLNRTPYALEELRPQLQTMAQSHPEQDFFLRADADVPYGAVVQVMDAVRQAGIVKLHMVTQPGAERR